MDLNGIGIEGRKVRFVGKDLVMRNYRNPRVVYIEPTGNLAVGDEDEVPDPGSKFLN